MNKIILVDSMDNAVGRIEKTRAHQGKGRRHRAFTAILKNDKGEVLLTRRSLKKALWPNFWDLSFSSHPWAGERLKTACQRRAKQELGIDVKRFKEVLSYEYHRRWRKLLSEWEINHILLAEYNGGLKVNSNEISEWKWMGWKKVLVWIKKKPEDWAPWVKIALEKGLKKL